MLFLYMKLISIYALARLIWKVVQKKFNRSVMDNLRGPEPSSFLMGCLEQFYDKNTGWAYHQDIAAQFGGICKIKALFGEDQIYTFDPKAMYHIFAKDQHIYEQHPLFISFSQFAYGEGLLGVLGDQHRKQRKMLNPVFSIAHMREMVPMFYDVARKLQQLIAKKVANGRQEIDLASFTTRSAVELIGQAGIGYSFDSLEEDKATHPFVKAAAGLIPSFYPLRFIAPFAMPLLRKYTNPRLCRAVMDLLPYKALHDFRDIIDVMDRTSREIYAQKKRALAEGNVALRTRIGQGQDIMSILMRANMSASKHDSLSESELLGQMTTLIFAAMDTTSNALSRIFHLLSEHPDVQERLRREMVEARMKNGGNDLPYDALVHLPYLDAVCRETFRVYPPVSLARRIAMHDVILPLSTPVQGANGQMITEIPVPKDTEIIIPIIAHNTNPRLWGPDAGEWKPERWLADLPEGVKEAQVPGVYSHLMTFIGGSRSCIGFKFSQLEMKVVICLLVEKFCFSPSKHEIIWQMNPVASPTVKVNDSLNPVLPIIVELA